MLSHDLTRYLDLLRATGRKISSQHTLVRRYVDFAEAFGDEYVRAERVLEWAVQASSPAGRRVRLAAVRRFALVMQAEDVRHEVPAADVLGHSRPLRRIPFIYNPGDIVALIGAAAKMRPVDCFRSRMYATLFGLLATTGMRVSEALTLKISDITEDGLVIRKTKFGKNRLIPLHDTTNRVIDSYLTVRSRLAALSDFVFVSRSGEKLPYHTVEDVFLKLTRSIGLRDERGRKGPRIHDLRHTFAVRSLEQCPHDRSAVARHVVALSTYLGHVGIISTYWYLQATPIVMEQIAEAGEALHQGGAQ
jgi:integrase